MHGFSICVSINLSRLKSNRVTLILLSLDFIQSCRNMLSLETIKADLTFIRLPHDMKLIKI